jgi:hypothetical protein
MQEMLAMAAGLTQMLLERRWFGERLLDPSDNLSARLTRALDLLIS